MFDRQSGYTTKLNKKKNLEATVILKAGVLERELTSRLY